MGVSIYIFAVAVALAITFAFLKWNGSLNNLGINKRLRLVERMYLGPRQQVVLIELDGEEHLLGVSSNSIDLLFSVKSNIQEIK